MFCLVLYTLHLIERMSFQLCSLWPLMLKIYVFIIGRWYITTVQYHCNYYTLPLTIFFYLFQEDTPTSIFKGAIYKQRQLVPYHVTIGTTALYIKLRTHIGASHLISVVLKIVLIVTYVTPWYTVTITTLTQTTRYQ